MVSRPPLGGLLVLLVLPSCAHLRQLRDIVCSTAALVEAADHLSPQAADALRRPDWGPRTDRMIGDLGAPGVCAVRRLSILGDPERVAEPMSAAAQADPVKLRAQEWLRSRGYEVKR